jgi:hypothetical protein
MRKKEWKKMSCVVWCGWKFIVNFERPLLEAIENLQGVVEFPVVDAAAVFEIEKIERRKKNHNFCVLLTLKVRPDLLVVGLIRGSWGIYQKCFWGEWGEMVLGVWA